MSPTLAGVQDYLNSYVTGRGPRGNYSDRLDELETVISLNLGFYSARNLHVSHISNQG